MVNNQQVIKFSGILFMLLFISFCSFSYFSEKISERNNPTKTLERSLSREFSFAELCSYIDSSRLSRYEKEIAKYELLQAKNPVTDSVVLFIGSSSIQRWKNLEEDMYPIPALNRGFGGAITAQTIFYIHRIVFPYKIKSIVYYTGDNDLANNTVPPEVPYGFFKIFVDSVHKYLPNTPIKYVSIKPSISRMKYWSKMEKANQLIKKYTESEPSLDFIDVSTAMFDSTGNIRKELFLKDNLHLNAEGYKLWTSIIKPAIEQY